MKESIKKTAVLVIVLMLASLVFATISKAATTELKNNLSVSNVSGKVGEEVKVSITASKELSVEDGGLLLKFDNKKLQYVSSTEGKIDDLILMVNNRNDGFIIAMVATGADATIIKEGTVLATVTFKILEGTTGTVDLTLVDDQADEKPTLTTGQVTVVKDSEDSNVNGNAGSNESSNMSSSGEDTTGSERK